MSFLSKHRPRKACRMPRVPNPCRRRELGELCGKRHANTLLHPFVAKWYITVSYTSRAAVSGRSNSPGVIVLNRHVNWLKNATEYMSRWYFRNRLAWCVDAFFKEFRGSVAGSPLGLRGALACCPSSLARSSAALGPQALVCGTQTTPKLDGSSPSSRRRLMSVSFLMMCTYVRGPSLREGSH